MVFGRGRADIVPGRGEQDRGALSDQVREDFLVAIAQTRAYSHALARITWALTLVVHPRVEGGDFSGELVFAPEDSDACIRPQVAHTQAHAHTHKPDFTAFRPTVMHNQQNIRRLTSFSCISFHAFAGQFFG